jgi:predicted lipoprotein
MRPSAAILLAAAGLALSSCRLVATSEVRAHAQANGHASFDADRMVADIWTAKVVPYLDKKAGGLIEVRDLALKDPASAGAKFGHREDSDGAPWT